MSNYGEDAFLRPGFSCQEAVRYLRDKIIEKIEIEDLSSDLLSRDWQSMFAASFVPRGMEQRKEFRDAMCWQLTLSIIEISFSEISENKPFQSTSCNSSGGHWTLCRRMLLAQILAVNCRMVFDHAVELRLYDQRISSESANQPRAVDSIIDNFPVEAQAFANSLAFASALSAGSLALRFFHLPTAQAISFILGFVNLFISFGTMSNVSRYKIKNEEYRVLFKDSKLERIKQKLFYYSSITDRKTVPPERNPFIVDLEAKAAEFRRVVAFYGLEEPIAFDKALRTLRRDFHSPEVILEFGEMVLSVFIPKTYHVNSYVQEALVDVLASTDRLLAVSRRKIVKGAHDQVWNELFETICRFEPMLEKSLQRGTVLWGFIKRRALRHWDICASVSYILSLCCPITADSLLQPMASKTYQILMELHPNDRWSNPLLQECRDFEELYWATRESSFSSLVFVSGFLVFVASGKN